MILTDDPLQAPHLEALTGLPDQLPHTQRDVTGEDLLVEVLGGLDKTVLDVVDCVTAISLSHSSSTVGGCGGLNLTTQHRHTGYASKRAVSMPACSRVFESSVD